METVKGGLYAPITGQYITLEEIADGVFSEGVPVLEAGKRFNKTEKIGQIG